MYRLNSFCLLWVLSSNLVADEPYPNVKLLVDSLPQNEPSLVILDARPKADYVKGHIADARWVDHTTWSKSFADGVDAKGWSERIEKLGIDSDSTVIVYDNNNFKDAARIWWILRYWGVADVRLLNGGWTGWEKSKQPISTTVKKVERSSFVAKPAPERSATLKEVMQSLDGNTKQIVDARSEDEHCGIDKKSERAGSIPGAKNLEWIDLIDTNEQRFKTPKQLQALFKQAGIELDRPLTAHCQSGGRASVMAFGLELMGAKNVENYYPGWSEWGNSRSALIEKPEPKK